MTPKAWAAFFFCSAVALVGFFAWDSLFTRSSRRALEGPFQGDWQDSPVIEPDFQPEEQRVTHRDLVRIDSESLARHRLTRDEWKAYVSRRDHPYSVLRGDTWESVAERLLGGPGLKKRLFEVNPTLDPRLPLSPGTTVVIPFRYRRPR